MDLNFPQIHSLDDSEWLWLGSTGDSFATIVLVMTPKTAGVMFVPLGVPNFHVSPLQKNTHYTKVLLYVWS